MILLFPLYLLKRARHPEVQDPAGSRHLVVNPGIEFHPAFPYREDRLKLHMCWHVLFSGAHNWRNFPMSSRSVPSTHFCCIMSDFASRRRCAFLRRALCNSIIGMNPSGLSSGSLVRPSIKFLVRES